jgi:L-seryl-tRNA(Ser) seleniumtransferase
MTMDEQRQARLRHLPGVDRMLELLRQDPDYEGFPKSLIVRCIRQTLDAVRADILQRNERISDQQLSWERLLEKSKRQIIAASQPNLKPVINATGVVVHTNLGRSLLAASALDHLLNISSRYSNLEFDLARGQRGSRYSLVEELLCEISGAEAAMVVNNNAAAVLLCLDTLAKGKKVIVSRGELVEIGGAFRIPEVMARSGAVLKEIGTTNRTHLRDYENAIETDSGLLLKVHTSNYSIVGFTASVGLDQLVALGAKYQLPVMEDLGSGTFIDFTAYGLLKEPTVQESVAAGVDLVTFSGDKLLGGPQAGIILGSRNLIDKIKQNPLTRALRIDKLTLAALESTLRLYRDKDQAVRQIPTLNLLTTPISILMQRAKQIQADLLGLGAIGLTAEILDLCSRVGGGALPLLQLPSKCVGVKLEGVSANTIESFMRRQTLPIIGRIETDYFVMDPRTIQDEEIVPIAQAFAALIQAPQPEGDERDGSFQG